MTAHEHPIGRILVADDDAPLLRLFRAVLAGQGHKVEIASDGEQARSRIVAGAFDVVLLDLTMGPLGGLALLDHTRRVSPDTAVVIITGNATVESAVQALKRGAHDYLVKPVRNEQLAVMVRRVLEMRRTGDELAKEKRRSQTLLADIRRRYSLARISGSTPRMKAVRELVTEVMNADSTVLILGESGTGKSLLARTIHFNSPRAAHPFIETNCAIYSEGLLMSELFGHETGAFTGAVRGKKGRFELAEEGTVFLDEVGDLPMSTQVALLRFLQERRFERVGGEGTIEADVRVIAATNRDLAERIAVGAFREDLFYRLNVIPITLPPLRERTEDIPSLAEGILAECAERLSRPVARLSDEAYEALCRYRWPGNIREMQNALERALLLSRGVAITAAHLPPDAGVAPVRADAGPIVPSEPAASLEQNEKAYILRVLEECRWNKKKAAGMLGINRSSLYSKLHRFGLMEASPGERAACARAGVQDPLTR